MNHFFEFLEKRVLILDGAMGTNLQKQNLTPSDYDGKEGCNEYLVVSKPEAVEKVHESFFKAGCDAVETNTFGANRIVLEEYGLSDRVSELNKKASALARKLAQKYSSPDDPRFVIGSVGPTTKLPTLGHISFDEMHAAFCEQISGLLEGGVDAVLIETCQDILQSKIAVIAADETMKKTGIRVPVICQITIEKNGSMLLGTDILSAWSTLENLPVDVIGMNCATGPQEMLEHVRTLSAQSSKFISVLPNAGLPENVDGQAVYKLTPKDFADFHEKFVKEYGVNVVGGCCGTTPEHLAEVVKRIKKLPPKKREFTAERGCSSLYGFSAYRQQPAPFLIGERTNANGSKIFRQYLEKNDFDSIVNMARQSVKEGIHATDVCVAYAGRDEKRDMSELVFRLNQQITVPIVIDSTEPPVIEEALKRISGKPVINSINLEDGEKKLQTICQMAKKYGAALIALVIDEKGMAKEHAKKIEVAERIIQLAVKKQGIPEEDLFFDMLTFTLASGDEGLKNAGIETLNAIRALKKNYPKINTILGVSNISFGLDPESRVVLNSMFLHYAIEAGLDAAIVHAAKILPLHKIEKEAQEIATRLIFNDSKQGNPLNDYIAYFKKRKGEGTKEIKKSGFQSVEESLKNKIIDGDHENLEKELDEALKKYPPLEIINTILMEGMKKVGELFGAGQMQLPFVLQSAEVMKKAVAHLESHMSKNKTFEKGRIVLATVKGDVHDIGKNLVDIILVNNGYKVYNLGIKQSIDAIIKAAEKNKADAIGLSGLLVKSTHIMKEYLEELNARNITLPVICGGAALTRKYVEEDLRKVYKGKVYYGQDAFSFLTVMEELKNPK